MFCCWLILSYWVIFSYWLFTWSCHKCRWEISFLNAGSEENLTLVVNIFLQPTVYSRRRPQKVQSISLRGQAKAIWAWIVWKPIYHKQPCAIISSNTSQYLLLYLQRPSKKWKCCLLYSLVLTWPPFFLDNQNSGNSSRSGKTETEMQWENWKVCIVTSNPSFWFWYINLVLHLPKMCILYRYLS